LVSETSHIPSSQLPRREGPLRITVLIDTFKHTGGMMMLLYYAGALKGLGHHVELLTQSGHGPVRFLAPEARVVPEFTSQTVPASDILLATGLHEVDAAHRSGRGRVVHFCQGFQVADLEERWLTVERRMQEGSLTLWMPRLRVWRTLRMALKKRSWQKRIAYAEHVYRLPTHMIACTPHLKKLMETRYGRKVHLCRYGIPPEFSPAPSLRMESFDAQRPCRVVCVGGYERWFKGIETTNKVIALVNSRGLPVHYVRVSPTPFYESEKSLGMIDEFHENLKPAELAELFRGSDVYISNSLESEGFGLPAMEAMCCGLPTILSKISSYTQFSDENVSNYAVFVPQRGVEETARALQELIESPAQHRRELRENALRVAAEYEQKRSNERYSRILQQIAAQP
jgi:glycosyltransferase involved in cell wall biosynthesis